MSVSLRHSALTSQRVWRELIDYGPVQDLHSINSSVITIKPVVQNPYTLLSLLSAQASQFTCVNLKDSFFCLQLPLFAFEWQDPHTGRKTQLTWTQLPQVLKNSLTLFGEALAPGLAAFPKETFICILIQYMDDLLQPVPPKGTAGEAPKPRWLYSPP